MIDRLNGKKKVLFDVCMNILASALPIAMLQLVIYPQVARVSDAGVERLCLVLTGIMALAITPIFAVMILM